jgi:hypothetical protein
LIVDLDEIMSNAARASFLHRLTTTPLRDAVRGRLSARLDWQGRLASSSLPVPARLLVERVVTRTRLWRSEKVDVADELTAHFLDASAAGEKIDASIAAFGDERNAVKLIRRARIRNRPLAWHAMRWARRAIGVMIVVYGVLALCFFLSRPQPKVDYLAELNRPIVAVPEADRAWPVYRQVILALLNHQPIDQNGNPASLPKWIGANVDGSHWPEAQAWLRAHPGDVESLQSATAKPALGFVLGPNGSVDDAQLWPGMADRARRSWSDFPSLIAVLLPYLNDSRALSFVLQADAKLAQLDHDGARVDRDIESILNLAAQVHDHDGFLITGMVAVSIDAVALNCIERRLLTNPSVLTDQQWIRLAHRIAKPHTASDLFSLDAERLTFCDILQHTFSDDGHGDGHLTAGGTRYLAQVGADAWSGQNGASLNAGSIGAYAFGPAAMAVVGSRKELLDKYDELSASSENNFRVPARDANWKNDDAFVNECKASTRLGFKYVLLTLLTPPEQAVSADGERYLGHRDGVMTAIALEIYRRQHSDYPQNLDEMTPQFLPSVPADRITGDPIKYRIKDGKPLLYSVGVDRIDDGGTPPARPGTSDSTSAAQWWPKPDQRTVQGDWILYPQTPGTDER